MSFLAPYMLWGALAAGVPVALHFFYRSRYRNVPWGAMKFLLAAIEQTSRRLRFQELLLLLLRVAMLLLLAFALARPTTATGRGPGGDAVDAVLVVDNSLSMGAKAGVVPPGGDAYLTALRGFARDDGGVTCFDRARAAAIALVGSLPAHSTVQIISAADYAEQLGPRTPSHLDQARKLLEDMPLSHRGTDYLPAVKLAAEWLASGPSPNKELYLLGDMQRQGFDAQSAALAEQLRTLKDKVSVHFVHCAPKAVRNVAVVGITPQTTLRGGERGDFAVLVRNAGKEGVRNLTLTLEIDGKESQRDSQPLVEIKPGETRAVVLSAMVEKPGRHVLTATVKPDDLDGDNRYDQVVTVADQVGVLIVDGAPDARNPQRAASYFLQHALDPLTPGAKSNLPVTLTSADKAAPRDLGGKEVCVLVNVGLEPRGKEEGGFVNAEFARALAAFVQEGKALVVVAGDRVVPEAYNRVLFEQLQLLPYRLTKVERAAKDKPWTLDRRSGDEQPYRRFREEQGYAGIDRIEVRQAVGVDVEGAEAKALAEESRVLLRYSTGQPAIVSRKRPGQGEVLLFTTSMSDPAWSDWYLAPAFVPFVQVTLNHLLDGQPAVYNRVVGEPIVWQVPPGDVSAAFDLIQPDGERRRLGFPAAVRGRTVVTAEGLTRAGLYRLAPAGREQSEETPWFAVLPDLRETEDLEYLLPAQIDTRLGFAARHTSAAEDGTPFTGAERLRREWTPWLLGLLLAVVVGEMVFAWYCGKSW